MKHLLAQTPVRNPLIPGLADQPIGNIPTLFGKMFSSIVGVLLIVASLWTFIELLMAGIMWISAGGDKGRVENAQQRILNAMIGLVVVAGSWAFYLLILNWLGITSGGPGFNFVLPKIF